VFRCWVAEYTAQPELDANANAVAFETIVLRNEGFERDQSVVEVAET
jgi:phage tail-like protein